jgi:uncharacterized membrane protein YgcG
MADFEGLLGSFPAFMAISALGLLIIGLGVVLKRAWAQRELEMLRKKYQETEVSDPQYNAVRALYISALIDHDRRSAADGLTSSGAPDGGSSGDSSGGGGD